MNIQFQSTLADTPLPIGNFQYFCLLKPSLSEWVCEVEKLQLQFYWLNIKTQKTVQEKQKTRLICFNCQNPTQWVSVPNFSSLAGLEVAEKFVLGGVVVVGNTWLLCLTPTLIALGFDKNNHKSQVSWYHLLQIFLIFRYLHQPQCILLFQKWMNQHFL